MTREVLEIPGAHLDEGALVRRMDGELDPAEAADAEAHLAACTRCRVSLAEIEAAAERLSSALRLIDPEDDVEGASPPADAWHRSPVWRAAAAVAFVAGLALAITPVRAWISERLGLADDGAGTELHVSAETPPGATGEEPGVRVAFVPTGERFRIVLAAPQREGALLLSVTPGDTASGEVLGSDDADLLVLPDGLGIRNHPFTAADYRVVIPADLERIEAWVAGRVVWEGTPSELSEDVRIDLADGNEP